MVWFCFEKKTDEIPLENDLIFDVLFYHNIYDMIYFIHCFVAGYGLSMNPAKLYFGVKFYATDPCKLKEEVTRSVSLSAGHILRLLL